MGHRDAALAHLAGRLRRIWVVSDLGGQVEGNRQARLALGEIGAIELVRGLGTRVAGVGPHHPGLVAGRRSSGLLGRLLGGLYLVHLSRWRWFIRPIHVVHPSIVATD